MILLTGATGYVGGRVLEELRLRGHRVRCLVRDPRKMPQETAASVEVFTGDLMDLGSMEAAMRGIRSAYYLVHSMAEGPDFETRERIAAGNFAEAARRAGVQRIIYLGGLGRGPGLSPHLKSRQDVGEVLRASGVQVLEFRASIVLGAGSLSFELMRALVERLPVMITPRWVSVLAQPIGIHDLLRYLVAALDADMDGHRTFEIGGSDSVSYGDIMREYAVQRGLRRLFVRVPVLTPRLSSLWLALVAPAHARVGRFLIDSIRSPSVVVDDSARTIFSVEPCGVSQAIREAIEEEDREYRELSPDKFPRRTRLVESCEVRVAVAPRTAFRPIERIGHQADWYYANSVWKLRDILDRKLGGAGNTWRVETRDPPRRFVLRTDMKLLGRAWLHFEIRPDNGGSIIRQTAIFDPRGLAGRLYWYLTLPIHRVMFAGMLARIASLAKAVGECNLPESASA